MKKTIISHIWNEEYLLPFWLNHHKKYFDHGIIIDYNSSDRSVEIIKEICPTWEVLPSRNERMGALFMDRELEDVERMHSGWKMVLSTTEFLVGDYKKLDTIAEKGQEILVPAFQMMEHPETEGTHPDPNIDLFEQKTFGIHYDDPIKYTEKEITNDRRWDHHIHQWNSGWVTRRQRLLHNHDDFTYPLGRHFADYDKSTKDFIIVYYRFCPWNNEMLNRISNLKNNLDPEDEKKMLGFEHFLDPNEHTQWMKEWQNNARDLSDEIKHFVDLMKK
jgi:hypothetical protein